MKQEPPRDWEKTWIHAFCGAVFGAALSLRSGNGWVIFGSTMVLAICAGIYLDRFWDQFLNWWRGY